MKKYLGAPTAASVLATKAPALVRGLRCVAVTEPHFYPASTPSPRRRVFRAGMSRSRTYDRPGTVLAFGP